MKKHIYLDYAAATPMDPVVKKATEPYWSERFHNPSAIYLSSRAVKKDLDTFRARVARLLGAKPAEIVFPSGATEANNLAISGVMSRHPKGELLVSAIEHESVLEPAKLYKNKQVPVDSNGRIILNKLSNLISDKTILVSIMMVNNELGTVQPLSEVSNLITQVREARLKSGNHLPLYLHSDGAQAGNYFDLQASRLGVDMMTVNGGKIYGPKQSGALLAKAGVDLAPLILGGGQEYGRRSGTESLALIAGFTEALEQAQSKYKQELKRTRELREFFAAELQNHLGDLTINGSIKHQSPHILSITLPGADNERLVMELDEAGIQVGVGSACSAAKGQSSHVLAAIGLSSKLARSTLRFSFGRQTTKEDLSYAVKTLVRLTAVQR